MVLSTTQRFFFENFRSCIVETLEGEMELRYA